MNNENSELRRAEAAGQDDAAARSAAAARAATTATVRTLLTPTSVATKYSAATQSKTPSQPPARSLAQGAAARRTRANVPSARTGSGARVRKSVFAPSSRGFGIFWSIDINSPVIIGFSVLSGIVLALNIYTDGAVNQALMSWYTDWLDPAMYLRFFTHVLAHADFAHYFGNMSLLLVVGPLMEERYGARRLALMLFASAFTTGFANALLFKNVAVVGASGLVFTLILLSSFVNLRKGKLPLTLLIVGAMYIGNEVVNAILVDDSVSRLSHVIGGLCGAGFGFYFAGTPTKRLE